MAGIEVLPQINNFRCIIKNPWSGRTEYQKKDSEGKPITANGQPVMEPITYFSLGVKVEDPVNFPKSGGDGETTLKAAFTVACRKSLAGKAFDLLMKAKEGDEIEVSGFLTSDYGRDKNGFNRAYGIIEATEAKLISTCVRQSVSEDTL